MDYLQDGTGSLDRIDQDLLTAGIELCKNTRLVGYLRSNGYSIQNLSPFVLDDSSDQQRNVSTVITEKHLIEEQTFLSVMIRKFGWLIEGEKLGRLLRVPYYNVENYNSGIERGLTEISRNNPGHSLFTYAHFLIPHSPFLKDSAGRPVSPNELIPDAHNRLPNLTPQRYIGYLQYGNSMLLPLLDTLTHNDPSSIILIMSDHGYRGAQSEKNYLQFDIQFFIRTPKGDYSIWPRTVDGVNVFRILLNEEFGQQLDYLPYKSREIKL
jgi:hypothetical protein